MIKIIKDSDQSEQLKRAVIDRVNKLHVKDLPPLIRAAYEALKSAVKTDDFKSAVQLSKLIAQGGRTGAYKKILSIGNLSRGLAEKIGAFEKENPLLGYTEEKQAKDIEALRKFTETMIKNAREYAEKYKTAKTITELRNMYNEYETAQSKVTHGVLSERFTELLNNGKYAALSKELDALNTNAISAQNKAAYTRALSKLDKQNQKSLFAASTNQVEKPITEKYTKQVIDDALSKLGAYKKQITALYKTYFDRINAAKDLNELEVLDAARSAEESKLNTGVDSDLFVWLGANGYLNDLNKNTAVEKYNARYGTKKRELKKV